MRVVKGNIVVALVEFEAKVLPTLDLADVGERHPQTLLLSAHLEILGKYARQLLERRPETPRRIEPV